MRQILTLLFFCSGFAAHGHGFELMELEQFSRMNFHELNGFLTGKGYINLGKTDSLGLEYYRWKGNFNRIDYYKGTVSYVTWDFNAYLTVKNKLKTSGYIEVASEDEDEEDVEKKNLTHWGTYKYYVGNIRIIIPVCFLD